MVRIPLFWSSAHQLGLANDKLRLPWATGTVRRISARTVSRCVQSSEASTGDMPQRSSSCCHRSNWVAGELAEKRGIVKVADRVHGVRPARDLTHPPLDVPADAPW